MLEVIAKYRGKAKFREQYLILGTTKDVQKKRVYKILSALEKIKRQELGFIEEYLVLHTLSVTLSY